MHFPVLHPRDHRHGAAGGVGAFAHPAILKHRRQHTQGVGGQRRQRRQAKEENEGETNPAHGRILVRTARTWPREWISGRSLGRREGAGMGRKVVTLVQR
ncbi:hypothetical protein GCM10011521_07730 [Arenimonas soli]|uniref:Uncharacterized protein n=1 Tax=Arenimonas soli TaxID=2269504 RepID=A0ABQ1HEA2_9GAMM|nr:hypothetical protein GCM10011521_07730 [Arenimonas soli]